jgi:hypothetical protein
MAASDALHPVQFRRDTTDRDLDSKDRMLSGDYVNDVYDPNDLREDQYERLGKDAVQVDAKAERKAMRIS